MKEKNIVAFHEAGHALVSKVLDVDLIQKISIVPRGQALGYVLKFPDEERYLLTERELFYRITGLLAGRAAEEYKFKEITTGAKDDLNKATEIAREMVCSYGMSSLGTLALDEVYIRYNYDSIRQEIKKITDKAYSEALSIIDENSEILQKLAQTLIEKEILDKEELDVIYNKYKKPFNYATT
jgi:cell division protease FtsH